VTDGAQTIRSHHPKWQYNEQFCVDCDIFKAIDFPVYMGFGKRLFRWLPFDSVQLPINHTNWYKEIHMQSQHPSDKNDVLRTKKDAFKIPEGVIYLDGNSLGVLPKNVPTRLAEVVEQEWGTSLIKSWNEHSWFDLPLRVGNRIGRLIGAPEGSVVACDSTSVNVFKVLAAALSLRPDRKVILSDNGNFPTDLYVASGLAELLGKGHELRVVAPEDVDARNNRRGRGCYADAGRLPDGPFARHGCVDEKGSPSGVRSRFGTWRIQQVRSQSIWKRQKPTLPLDAGTNISMEDLGRQHFCMWLKFIRTK
jgi:hypothetical protein